MTTTRFYTQIKLTHREGGQSAGWQCLCNGHADQYKAIACKEKTAAAMLVDPAKTAYADQAIEIRMIKITEEIVEEAQEVKAT